MKKLIEAFIQAWDKSSIREIGPNSLKVRSHFHKKLISFCSLMNLLHCNLTFIWQIFIDNVSVFIPMIHELRIEFRNWETILLKYGNFMFQLESSGSIIMAINLLEIDPYLVCSVEWSEIENNMRINRAYDSCHDLGILDFPLNIFIRLVFIVRSRTGVINMTPKVLNFHKFLELELVLVIKTNQ